jgi:hypothetical protein
MTTAIGKRPACESQFLARLMRDFGANSERWLRERLCQPFLAEWVAANGDRFRPVKRGPRRGYQ